MVGNPLRKLDHPALWWVLFGCLLAAFAYGVLISSEKPSGNKIAQRSHDNKKQEIHRHKLSEWKWGDADPGATVVTSFLVIVGALQVMLFWRQLKFMSLGLADAKKAADAAKDAADAAKLNAQAVINAERAHIFVVIGPHNIHNVLPRRGAGNSVTDRAIDIKYGFKNHGKTPAFIRSMAHGTMISSVLSSTKPYEPVVDLPVHILGAGEETDDSERVNSRIAPADVDSIANAEKTFWFYGDITYDDMFGITRTHWFVWHYGADCVRFSLYDHGEREESGS